MGSNAYLCERESFFKMKKLYDQLCSDSEDFRVACNGKAKEVVLVHSHEDVFTIRGTKTEIDLSGYDLDLGEGAPVSLRFSKVFKYKPEGGYSYC